MISIHKELAYFQEIRKNSIFQNNQLYRTEWRIYDEDFGIAGTIDCLLKSPTGKYIIIDWKRSEKIGGSFNEKFIPQTSNQWQSGIGIFSHIDDTPYNRYKLQLNLYAHILSSKYNIKVGALYLAILHPKYSKGYLLEVDIDPETTISLLHTLKKH